MRKIISYFANMEFLKFIIVGGINTISGIILSYAYSQFLQTNIAFICGYATSLIIGYILNSRYTFREKLSFAKFVKFAASYIPNFIIQNLMVIVLYNGLHWHKLLVYVLAAAIGVPVTFMILKLFTFKK